MIVLLTRMVWTEGRSEVPGEAALEISRLSLTMGILSKVSITYKPISAIGGCKAILEFRTGIAWDRDGSKRLICREG